MKKNILLILISGLIFTSGILAGTTLINSNQVSYKDTTVDLALDDLFDNSLTGKNNIITALQNKGFDIEDNSNYANIISGINELPITLSKDEEGNYGYIITDEEGADTVIPFKSGDGKELYYLGYDTSFDVKTFIEENGLSIDYTTLTINDFIYNTISPSVSLQTSNYVVYIDGIGCNSKATLSISQSNANYNNVSGILTIESAVNLNWSATRLDLTNSYQMRASVLLKTKAYLII